MGMNNKLKKARLGIGFWVGREILSAGNLKTMAKNGRAYGSKTGPFPTFMSAILSFSLSYYFFSLIFLFHGGDSATAFSLKSTCSMLDTQL